MIVFNKIKHLLSFCLICFLLAGFYAESNKSFAKSGGIGRIRSCSQDGKPENLDFDPTNGGKDVEFVLSNPSCTAVIAYSYGAVKAGITYMNAVCNNKSGVPRVTPSPILDAIDITKSSVKAVTNASCAAAVGKATLIFSSAIGYLGGIYAAAERVYNNAEICGSNWMAPNPTQFLINQADYKATVENKIEEYLNDPFERKNLNFNNKDYREWFYGGVEVEYEGCRDVSQDPIVTPSGNKYPPQKYYFRGYDVANFNCERYDILPGQTDPRDGSVVTTQRLHEYREAYNCCVEKAQNYVCIKYNNTKKLCRAGERCEIDGIYFDAYSEDNKSRICAKTYSLCPYNFFLGGGSDVCDYYQDGVKDSQGNFKYIETADVASGNCANNSEIRNADCSYNNKAGKCRNYCQYMRHCTKTNNVYKYRSTIASPYFSSACINFAGDSRNVASYGTGFILGSARHFSAPIAQCIKETLENLFMNRAGHTKCLVESDVANSNGQCENGVAYAKGDQVEDRSFFEKIQDNLRLGVKAVLTLSITFLGVKMLLGGEVMKKSELMMYIIKFGIVMFFAIGTAWQNFFFDGVYNASNVLSQMVFKIQMPEQEEKRDGCQFGITTDAQGNPIVSAITYPKGKEYLAIWDTLDCKIARYLGYGPQVSVANIAKLILAGWLTGPIGIYFSVALLFFGFCLIALTIKSIHIFVGSTTAIIILIFVSPITITAMMFKKTESIFKNWLKQIVGFSLQPMILFAFIAIFISIFDKTLTGSATFYGPPPLKSINCKQYCVNANGDKVGSRVHDYPCDKVGEEMIRPRSDSFACLIGNKEYSNWPGFEIFGISIPFIIGLFEEDAKKRVLTIIKAAIVVYFLNKFMGEIPGIASQLVGGGKLPMSKTDATSIFKGVSGMVRGVQKRGSRVLNSKASKSYGAAKEYIQHARDKNRSPKSDSKNSSDETGSSNSGSSDRA